MKVDTRKEEAALLDIQIVTSIFFIIALIITIILNINEKYKLLNSDPFLDDDTVSAIRKRNRLLILGLFVIYLYINLKQKEYDEINGRDLTPDNLEIFVSSLTVIGALIILYEVFVYDESNVALFGNPTV